MSYIRITGHRAMEGSCYIKAAKNSVLPILACSIMCTEVVRIHNCPDIRDVRNMLKILRSLGAWTELEDGVITVDTRGINITKVAGEAAGAIRSSVFTLGPILAKFGRAQISYPGGCNIGTRPIDLHLDGLRAMAVDIIETADCIVCDGSNMRACNYTLRFASVGATENLIMASALTKGRTVIRNAAKEPEIVDLANFLAAMGGRISGQGTDTITIDGVEALGGGDYTPIPDRIVAGTYMVGCAMCGGCIRLDNADGGHLAALIDVLERAGAHVVVGDGYILVASDGKLRAVDNIATDIYPGFATDMQAQIMAMLSIADGVSVIEENLFETRLRHASELCKMGANISVEDNRAIVSGVPHLYGAKVAGYDLRGGAAMVLAGLAADGDTVVTDVGHIMRGYEDISRDLRELGCAVWYIR